MKRKEKKNPILVYPGLRYTHKKLNFACKTLFFKNCLFEYENQFAIEKTQKNFGGNFKNNLSSKIFCRRHQKNASHTISIYGNCMTSVCFQKTKIKKVKVFNCSSPKNA